MILPAVATLVRPGESPQGAVRGGEVAGTRLGYVSGWELERLSCRWGGYSGRGFGGVGGVVDGGRVVNKVSCRGRRAAEPGDGFG